MLHAKVGFVVFGVHKDGLKDPMGDLFIDNGVIERSKQALRENGIELLENDLIVSTKREAREVILPLAKDESCGRLDFVFGYLGMVCPYDWRNTRICKNREGDCNLDLCRLPGVAAGRWACIKGSIK